MNMLRKLTQSDHLFIRKIKKVLLIAALILITALISLLIFTQTSLFRSFAVNIAQSQAANYLNGSLQIGSLEGNFLSHIKIHDIKLNYQDESNIVYIDEIALRYNLTGLLRKRIRVEYIDINGLQVSLIRDGEHWNIQSLLKERETEKETTDSDSSDWTILLQRFSIINSSVSLTDYSNEEGFIPTLIDNLNLSLSLDIVSDKIDLSMQELHCQFFWEDNHRIVLDRFSFDLSHSNDETSLSDFVFRTGNTSLFINGMLNQYPDISYTAGIEIAADNLKDISYFAPDIDKNSSISSVIFLQGDRNELETDMAVYLVDIKNKAIKIDASLKNLSDFADNPLYEADIRFDRFHPTSLLPEKRRAEMGDVLLNGSITLSGNSLDYSKGEIDIDINLHNLIYLYSGTRYLFPSLTFNSSLKERDLKAQVSIAAKDIAEIETQIHIKDIQKMIEGDLPLFATEYSLQGEINKFNPAEISDFQGDLNLAFSSSGDESEALFTLNFLPSNIAGIDIERFELDAAIYPDKISVNQLDIILEENRIQLTGNIITPFNGSPAADFEYAVYLPDTATLAGGFSDIENEFDANISLKGSVTGKIDSLTVRGDMLVSNPFFDEYSCRAINTNFAMLIYDNIITAGFNLEADSILIDETYIEKVKLNGDIAMDNNPLKNSVKGDINIQIVKDRFLSMQTELDITHREDSSSVAVGLSLQTGDIVWSTGQDKSLITFIPEQRITVEDFSLSSHNQSLYLSGSIYFDDSSDNEMEIKLSSIDLDAIAQILENENLPSGYIDFYAALSGNMSNPELLSNLSVSSLTYQEIENIALEADFHYPLPPQELFSAQLLPLNDTFSGSITVSTKNQSTKNQEPINQEHPILNSAFYIPLGKSDKGGIKPLSGENLYISVKTVPLDLSLYDNIVDRIDNLKGELLADLEIYRSLDYLVSLAESFQEVSTGNSSDTSIDRQDISDGHIAFNLSIKNGALEVKELGTRYRDIEIEINTTDNSINISRFNLLSGNGTLSVKGNTTFLENETPLSVGISADNFPVITNETFDFLMNSRITLAGTLESPTFNGSVNLPRGRVNLDRLLADSKLSSGETPLLEIARQDKISYCTTDGSDVTGIADIEDTGRHKPERRDRQQANRFSPIDRARGTIAVSFPRNVWIRSSDMNIELSSDIEIVKRDVNFEIFGTLNTIRGFYIFYGKRLQIETGEITFTGGTDINPHLSIVLDYRFRGIDKSRNNLKMIVSGTLEDLSLAFQLNDSPIEEADAISYIIFNRSFEELTRREKAEASNQALLLGGLLANRLAGVLTDVVGESLRLDLIEFRSDTASSQVGLEVGKYLTDNLFVSFKRDFNISDSNEPVTEEVVVEYEIRPFLLLQGTKSDDRDTGLDLIWRLKWD